MTAERAFENIEGGTPEFHLVRADYLKKGGEFYEDRGHNMSARNFYECAIPHFEAAGMPQKAVEIRARISQMYAHK